MPLTFSNPTEHSSSGSSRLAAITRVFRMMPHSSSLPSPATDSWLQSDDSSLNSGAQPVAELPEDSIIGIRSKCPRFRILVIGRANAGKTTLLKRVCNSVEEPEIYDEGGKKIKAKILKESMKRGEHNIENQMIFKSNPGFIFHDSRGFESGALEESEKAKNFIKTRAASSSLAQQLHAIWYCLPMADTTRPILKTDEEFFDLEGVGNVPVIAIFTKCDGLFTEVRGDLLAGGTMDSNELNTKCIEKVGEILTTRFTALQQLRFAPAAHVNTQDMGEPWRTGTAQKKAFAATQDECVKKLVQVTAGALTNEALQLLFVSVQRNNLDLCTFYAVRRLLLKLPISSEKTVVENCLLFFPHTWRSEDYNEKPRRHYYYDAIIIDHDRQLRDFRAAVTTCISILKRHLILEPFHSTSAHENAHSTSAVQVAAAICMCAQQIFFDDSAMKRTFTSAFEHAVAVYSKQASASGFLDGIEQCTGNLTDLNSDFGWWENVAQEVADMIKKYCPLIFGEAKG